MTRILLPVFIGIMVLLLGSILLPIFFRGLLWEWRRRKASDDWADDVKWHE